MGFSVGVSDVHIVKRIEETTMNKGIELNKSNTSIVAITDDPGNYIIKHYGRVICGLSFKEQGYVDVEEIKSAAAQVIELEIARQRMLPHK